jgi:cytochrome c oxidase assembly protein subunit 15
VIQATPVLCCHVDRIRALLGTPGALRRVALASIIANVGIVVTGGAVRLTGSGLGCPTWPRCTDDSYVTTAEMGINGAIEFSNRLLTYVVGLIALLAVVAAVLQRRRSRRTVLLAVAVLAQIPTQAVVGGITVLTDLNPWVVGCHFLVSMVIIGFAYALWRSAIADAVSDAAPLDRPRWSAAPALQYLGIAVVAVTAAVLFVGVVVTGSGPHAGDADARRNGLDPRAVTQLHADGVFLLIGLTIGVLFAVWAVGAPRVVRRTALTLLLVELAQGLIGLVQYVTDLPRLLVGAHMAGSCAVLLAALAVYANLRVAYPTPLTRVKAQLPEALTRPRPAARDGDPDGHRPPNGEAALGLDNGSGTKKAKAKAK